MSISREREKDEDNNHREAPGPTRPKQQQRRENTERQCERDVTIADFGSLSVTSIRLDSNLAEDTLYLRRETERERMKGS